MVLGGENFVELQIRRLEKSRKDMFLRLKRVLVLGGSFTIELMFFPPNISFLVNFFPVFLLVQTDFNLFIPCCLTQSILDSVFHGRPFSFFYPISILL